MPADDQQSRKRSRSRRSAQTDDGPPIEDSPDWKVGDFELISSNNVRYRVPSYYLQSNRRIAVFRDMLSLGGDDNEKKVHFTDDCERSSVLHDFLDLVVKGRFNKENDELLISNDTFLRSVRLLRFLQKYDCALAKNALLSDLHVLLHQTHAAPTFVFALGTIADDVDICVDALAMANRCGRDLPIGWEWEDEVYSIRPLDFGVVAWGVVPPAYQWALYKTQEVLEIGGEVTDDDNVTTYFREALDDARGACYNHEYRDADRWSARAGGQDGFNVTE